jgi:hypothetical protein
VTTLLDKGDALVVRCDECRRLLAITRARLESWQQDTANDLHSCPVCTADRSADASSVR